MGFSFRRSFGFSSFHCYLRRDVRDFSEFSFRFTFPTARFTVNQFSVARSCSFRKAKLCATAAAADAATVRERSVTVCEERMRARVCVRYLVVVCGFSGLSTLLPRRKRPYRRANVHQQCRYIRLIPGGGVLRKVRSISIQAATAAVSNTAKRSSAEGSLLSNSSRPCALRARRRSQYRFSTGS